MLSDVVAEAIDQMEWWRARWPDAYEPHRAAIDAALARLHALLIELDRPPDVTEAERRAEEGPAPT